MVWGVCRKASGLGFRVEPKVQFAGLRQKRSLVWTRVSMFDKLSPGEFFLPEAPLLKKGVGEP